MRPLLLVLAALATPGLSQFQAFRTRGSLAPSADTSNSLTELEDTPFTLANGAPYRDMLTIGASRAVAQYAARHQPQERIRINRIRAEAERNPALSPKFYSATLSQPIGHPALDSPDFSTSRRIRIPTDLEQDRVIADRDEATLTSEDRSPAANLATINRPPNANGSGRQVAAIESTRFGAGRPAPAAPLRRPSPPLGRPRAPLGRPSGPAPSALPSGNYQSVTSHGSSYSSGGAGYPQFTATPPPPADVSQLTRVRTPAHTAFQSVPYHQPAPYAAGPVPYAAAAPAYLPLSVPVATATAAPVPIGQNAHGFNLNHGSASGSYSYSTFG